MLKVVSALGYDFDCSAYKKQQHQNKEEDVVLFQHLEMEADPTTAKKTAPP